MTIEIKQLNKAFGSKQVLNDITKSFAPGQIHGLIGPNGVGKTTFMRAVVNIDTRYQGSVLFNNVSNKNPQVYHQLSYFEDNRILFPQLSGYEHLRFLAGVHGLKPSRIDYVVDKLGIRYYIHQRTRSYSLGMKQHLLLAMVLLPGPDYLIFDEPFNGLDPTSVIKFKALFRQLRDQGRTMIVSSHNLDLLSDLADSIHFLKDGKLTTIELDDSIYQKTYLEVKNLPRLKKLAREHNLPLEIVGQELVIGDNLEQYMQQLFEWQIQIQRIRQEQTFLEEIYHQIYEAKS